MVSRVFQNVIVNESVKKNLYCSIVCCREMFEESREKVTTLFPEDVEPVPWLFHSKMIFKRLNAYLQRLRIIDVSFSRDCRGNL